MATNFGTKIAINWLCAHVGNPTSKQKTLDVGKSIRPSTG